MRRRLSLATISRDGAFSDFSGYDRTFVLASGAGVVLRDPHAAPVVLDQAGALYAFAGEREIACALLDGEATAFNVMTRRATDRAHVAVHALRPVDVWSPPPATDYVFVIAGSLAAPAGGLRASDTLRLDRSEGASPVRALEPALVVSVGFAETVSP